jgi:UDP-glucose 4-epimerase
VHDLVPTTAVIGASGFIGSAVSAAIVGHGGSCARYTRSVPFVTVAGELDEGVCRARTIYWLASSIRPAAADSRASEADQRAMQRLLKLLSDQHPDSPRLVVVSSGGTVYDAATPPPYSELSPTRAVNSYGAAMLAIEALVAEHGSEHLVIRASNAYGPGQPARRGQGVIAHWFDSLARHEPIHIIGNPQTARDYIYIDDLVEALLRVADLDSPPPVVNIGSGVGTSLAELADLVASVTAREVAVSHDPGRDFDAPSTWLDVGLARSALGWSPTVPLADGLATTWRARGGNMADAQPAP